MVEFLAGMNAVQFEALLSLLRVSNYDEASCIVACTPRHVCIFALTLSCGYCASRNKGSITIMIMIIVVLWLNGNGHITWIRLDDDEQF